MVQLRTYLALFGQKISKSKFPWGGTDYYQLLFKSGESIPANVAVSEMVDVVAPDSNSEAINTLFLFPYQLDHSSIIDGTVTGNFTAQIYMVNSNYDTFLTKAIMDLVKIDENGVETSICGGDQTIWTGSVSVSGSTATHGFLF